MLLENATIGKVVYDPNDMTIRPARYGHIIGFDINETAECILVVRWCDGQEETVHPDVVVDFNG